MIKGLIALAFGALSFGVVEFVAMGLIPYFAKDFDISTAQAGHAISVYALGVMAGAAAMVFCRKFNLKHMMLAIIFIHLIGTMLTPFAPTFEILLLCRFVGGLPHGCFFGVGAIIAQKIAKAGRSSTAMAIMVAGQTVSIVFGVPLGTALAHAASWEAIFYVMSLWAVVVLASMIIYLPDVGTLEDKGFFSQFAFLKRRAPYLIYATILLANGGIFCVQTYISPLLTDYAGLDLGLVPAALIGTGAAMMIFNLVSGRLADRFTPGKVNLGFMLLCVLSMGVFCLFGSSSLVVALVAVCFIAGSLFGLASPQQVSIVKVSAGGELLGVALGQVSFNFGNACGAFLGGIPFDYNLPLYNVVLIGLGLLVIGFFLMLWYVKKDEAGFLAADELAKARHKARQEEQRLALLEAQEIVRQRRLGKAQDREQQDKPQGQNSNPA